MADWFDYEITLVGRTEDVGPIIGELQVEDTTDGFLNTPDLRIRVDYYDRLEEQDELPGSQLSFDFSGQCAWDDAEVLVNRLRQEYDGVIDVYGMMQGNWEPI